MLVGLSWIGWFLCVFTIRIPHSAIGIWHAPEQLKGEGD
jgi:hypothetical protein